MNQEFKPCRYCGRQGSDMHHLLKRSTSPELIDDPKNLVLLCRSCHSRTESDNSFLRALQEIFYYWKPTNLDLYLRAQASIDALLEGREVEYLTPGMTDHYLQLSGASYNYYSEQLAELEKLRPAFYIARKKESQSDDKSISDKYIEMEWQITSNGQKMIDYSRKLKALEKTQSNLKAKLRRMEIERFNNK